MCLHRLTATALQKFCNAFWGHVAQYFGVLFALLGPWLRPSRPIFGVPGVAGGESGSTGDRGNAPCHAGTRWRPVQPPWAWRVGRSFLS